MCEWSRPSWTSWQLSSRRRRLLVAGTLVCAECEREAHESARGWLAFLVDLADDEEEPEVVIFCSACRAREFSR